MNLRIIPCLLLAKGKLIKSVKFKDYQYVGDPINAVKIFNEKEADEIAIIDIGATASSKPPGIRYSLTLLNYIDYNKQEAKKEIMRELNSADQFAIDKPYVLKKLGFSEEEFDAYLAAPPVEHTVYGCTRTLTEDFPILEIFRPIKNLLIPREWWLIGK